MIVAELLQEITRLRGELLSIVHVCRGQGTRAAGEATDPVVQVIESIALEAIDARPGPGQDQEH